MRWMGFRGEGKKSNHRFHRFHGFEESGTVESVAQHLSPRADFWDAPKVHSAKFLTGLKICVICATGG
jgi:hypothetical protein